MDNSKRNVHNSGPLGMLVKNGRIKKVDYTNEDIQAEDTDVINTKTHGASYFKTETGLEFTEQELIYVDPKECESWQYANRHDNELGDIEGLIDSIRANKQLQPALIRTHTNPHDGIKYEVIFGRRRHIACLKLGIPFLAIRKGILNMQDAIASQDAENKVRNDVSNYSNAFLYQRLLKDGIFQTEKELAEKLGIPASSFNDLMIYVRIPNEVVKKIPSVHKLSKSFALKIVALVNKSQKYRAIVEELAPQIGANITSPIQLQKQVENKTNEAGKTKQKITSIVYTSQTGHKLFTFKHDQRGMPSVVMNKELSKYLDLEKVCRSFQKLLEEQLGQSGYPD